jgi:hypothetical protein
MFLSKAEDHPYAASRSPTSLMSQNILDEWFLDIMHRIVSSTAVGGGSLRTICPWAETLTSGAAITAARLG